MKKVMIRLRCFLGITSRPVSQKRAKAPRQSFLILEQLESRELLSATVLPGPSTTLNAAEQLALIQHPASNPTLPAGMDVFNPPVANLMPPTAAPQLATLTSEASPDDTVAATGYQLSALIGPGAGQDTAFQVYGQTTGSNADLTTAAIQEINGNDAAFTLPAGLPQNSMYLVWAENAAGASLPFAINKTDAWWVGPNVAAPGQTVSVYGENLSNGASTPQSWIYLQPAQGQGQWIAPIAVNPYKVDFVVPANLAAGSYQVWVHNGHGGQYGWSSPQTLTVQAPINYSHTVMNLSSFPGGLPNTGVDATPAFAAAIAAIGTNGPATIELQAGTYYISSELYLGAGPLGILLEGDGENATFIKALPSFSGEYFINTNPPSAVSNLTVDVTGASLGSGDALAASSVSNVYVIAHGNLDLEDSTNNSIISNCTFVGEGVVFTNASEVSLTGCDFYATDMTAALVDIWNGEGISITNCTAQNYNVNSTSPADHGMGRFIDGGGIWGTESNLYFAGNTTIDFAPDPNFGEQNSGEQILWEGNESSQTAMATSATSTTITLNSLTGDYTGQEAVIVSGTGVGEHRTIAATDFATGGTTLTLDSPWDVIPDATTQIDILTTVKHVVVYHNNLQGNSNWGSASTGVEPYQGGFDIIIAQNTLSNFVDGVCVVAYAAPGFTTAQPLFSTIVEDNTISNCVYGIRAMDLGGPNGEEATFLGNVFRNNTMTAIQTAGWYLIGSDQSGPGTMDLVIFEHNQVSDAPLAIDIAKPDGSETVDLVVRENIFNEGAAPAGSQPIGGITGYVELLQGNMFLNYLTMQGPAGTITSLTPNFAWSALPGATHYEVWVSDLTTGRSPAVFNANIQSTSWTPTTPLTSGHSYCWWVEAMDNSGLISNWSAGQDFYVAALAAPALSGPYGSPLVLSSASLTPTLSWAPVNAANSYDVWISDLTTGQAQVLQQTTAATSFVPGAPLTVGHQYEWWVQALNSSGNSGGWSGGYTFTLTLDPPTPATGPFGTIYTASPTFSWTPVTSAAFYDVWVNDTSTAQSQVLRSPLSGSQAVTGTSWTANSALVPGNSYEWWVRAISNNGASSSWSTGDSFTLGALSAPILTSPIGAAYRSGITFIWTPVTNAAYYYVLVYDVTAGNTVAYNNPNDPYTDAPGVNLTAGHTYEWWVQAYSNGGDYSAWSSEATFLAT